MATQQKEEEKEKSANHRVTEGTEEDTEKRRQEGG
jgi:hypothetical protein